METLLPTQLCSSFSEVIPTLFVDTLKEKMPELLTDSLKLNLPSLLTKNVTNKINKKLKKDINSDMHVIIDNYFMSVNKQFNALNKLECIETILRSTSQNLLPGIVNAKNLTIMVNKTSNDITKLVDLLNRLVKLHDPISSLISVATKGEKSKKAATFVVPADAVFVNALVLQLPK
ncbi:hypothetical protein Tco_0931507 [Tanacetum coccineum]